VNGLGPHGTLILTPAGVSNHRVLSWILENPLKLRPAPEQERNRGSWVVVGSGGVDVVIQELPNNNGILGWANKLPGCVQSAIVTTEWLRHPGSP